MFPYKFQASFRGFVRWNMTSPLIIARRSSFITLGFQGSIKSAIGYAVYSQEGNFTHTCWHPSIPHIINSRVSMSRLTSTFRVTFCNFNNLDTATNISILGTKIINSRILQLRVSFFEIQALLQNISDHNRMVCYPFPLPVPKTENGRKIQESECLIFSRNKGSRKKNGLAAPLDTIPSTNPDPRICSLYRRATQTLAVEL